MDIELSIVVPIYNVEIYLEECLDSLYKIENIKKEIILVNDGSTDNSLMIAKEYKKKNPMITKLINKENGGLSSARNAGLEIAIGEYISFIDSDDFIDSKNYEKFFRKGQEEKLDIIVGTPLKYIDGKIEKFYRSDKVKELKTVSGINFLEESIKTNCYRMEVWDDIYKRELIQGNNLSFKEKLLHEDELFTPLVFSRAKKVKLIDIDFYYYRQREGSIMNLKTERNKIHRIYVLTHLITKVKPLKSHFYWNYIGAISNKKEIYLKNHILILLNTRLNLREFSWFFRVLKYIKKIKFQIKI